MLLYDPGGAFGDNPLGFTSLVEQPLAPTSSPKTGFLPGAILASLLFSFPVHFGLDPAANDGQTVTVVVLDSLGQPVIDGVGPEAPTSLGVAGYGYGLYSSRVACPPGFAGSVQAQLTTGPNAGQTDAQPVDFSRAIDISPLCITAGGPVVNVLDPAQLAVEGSDGWVYVRVTAAGADSLVKTDLTNNPVEIAIVGGVSPGGRDFLPAEWLAGVSGPVKGVYARLYLSALDGTAPLAGAYRVFVRINGTTVFRAPSILIVQRSRGSGIFAPSAVDVLPISLPLSPSQFAVLQAQNTQMQAQNAALTKQLGDFIMAQHLIKTGNYVTGATISATSAITKPAQNTEYPVDTTAGPVTITLYSSTGDGTDLGFVRIAGTNPVLFALAAGDTCPLALANTTLSNTGETQYFRELKPAVMEAH